MQETYIYIEFYFSGEKHIISIARQEQVNNLALKDRAQTDIDLLCFSQKKNQEIVKTGNTFLMQFSSLKTMI